MVLDYGEFFYDLQLLAGALIESDPILNSVILMGRTRLLERCRRRRSRSRSRRRRWSRDEKLKSDWLNLRDGVFL